MSHIRTMLRIRKVLDVFFIIIAYCGIVAAIIYSITFSRLIMSVKILKRIPRTAASMPILSISNHVASMDPPYDVGPINALGSFIKRLGPGSTPLIRGARRAVDDIPPTIAERITEFLAMNAPSVKIGFEKLLELVSKVKVPLAMAVGVAAIAGIVYTVWKLYQHFTPQKAQQATSQIMKDLEATAPDLVKVPGWYETIKEQVEAAINSGDEADTIKTLAAIKEAVIARQKTISPGNVGGGICLLPGIRDQAPRTARKNVGRGLKVAM